MGYPGNQGIPGNWPAEEPSRTARVPEAAYGPEATYGGGQEGREASSYGTPWGQDQADLNQPTPGDSYRPPQGNGFPGPPQDNGFAAPTQGNGFPAPPQGNRYPGPPQGGDDPYGPAPGGQYSPGGFDDDAYGGAYSGAYEEGPGMPGPGMRGRGAGPMPREKRRLPLIIGGAALAGLLLVGGGVVLSSMLKDDSAANAGNASANPGRSPTAPASPSRPVLEPVKLKSRATDPSAMSLREAFGKARFTGSGKKYVRTAWHIHPSCTGAVQGIRLAAAMRKGGCTQVLRATYARGDGLLVGTIGVFNLETEYAAKVAQRAATAKDAFLEPVRGTGYSRTIGKGEALGTAEARGHYLVMTWVQRPDGKKVETKYHAVVSTFGQHLIRGSGLSFALHYRETEGKPFRN